MISSIVVTGLLKDTYKGHYRLVETRQNEPFNTEKEIVSLIPVAYWTKEENNMLFKSPNGTHAVIKGHLETDPEIGLYVLAEIVEVY